MKKITVSIAVFFALAMVIAAGAMGQNQDNGALPGLSAASSHVKNATAVGEVFGDGEKITTVILEYNMDIDNSKLSASDFSVKDRTITKVYANKAAEKAAQGVDGRFVVIEMNPSDAAAAILSSGSGSPGGPGASGGPGGPGSGPGGAKQGSMRMPKIERRPVMATVAQVGDIVSVTGKTLPATPQFFDTNEAVNLIVDDFKQLVFKDAENGNTLKYNLYVPKNYDKTKSYPLVLFMHDASVVSDMHDLTLIQGNGAVIWASPEDQAKHPAFVLAPQFSTVGTDNPQRWATVKHLIEFLTGRYRIDKNRLYTTGQSMGCMLSLAINIKYPDLFAASFYVAGQWDPQATAVLKDKKAWIVVSEGDFKAFPGMNASVKVWEENGAKISRGRWSAQAPPEEQAADFEKMIAEGNDINYVTYIKGTTFPPELANSGGQEHMNTWKFAYNIPAIRDWVFQQSKAPRN